MPTRQELYDRIRKASRDEVILEEMIRLGFWPSEGELPVDPADEIRTRGELERQLRSLTSENNQLQNAEAIKRAARKRRLEESRHKRREAKERKLKERQNRAQVWRSRKCRDISYLGKLVSGGLSHDTSDANKLRHRNLAIIHNADELATAMKITVGALRFLAFSRRTSKTTHYRRFAIAKKTGGFRKISAPMPRLKRAQEWIVLNILDEVELHRSAHGFRRGRSIVTNAQPHVNSDVVINMDLENFFPTISYKRIRGVFRNLGYGEQVSTILALLCSEPEITELEIDGHTYYVAQSDRFLPQGAPSSPAITNIICRGLDARMDRAARALGFTYTRYADDMTFSGSSNASANIGRMLRQAKHLITAEGFLLNTKKTRLFRRANRQEVTGLVVNHKVAVPRHVLRRFRATLYQIEKDGPAGKRWGASQNVLESIEGFANFVAMVDEAKGRLLQQQVRSIIDRHGRGQSQHLQRARWQPEEPINLFPTRQDPGRAKRKPWWKFW